MKVNLTPKEMQFLRELIENQVELSGKTMQMRHWEKMYPYEMRKLEEKLQEVENNAK